MANPLPNNFKKEARLRAAPEFQAAFKNGLKVPGVFFRLYFLQNDITRPRLGMAVPKKAIQQSVQRNRLKRICREVFRQNDNLAAGDYVLVAQARAKTADNTMLRDELHQLLRRFSQQNP